MNLHEAVSAVLDEADRPLTSLEVHDLRREKQGGPHVNSGTGATIACLQFLCDRDKVLVSVNDDGARVWRKRGAGET